MNEQKAKEIRKAIGFNKKEPNAVLKRIYGRAKKAYTRVTKEEKVYFIENLTKKA